MSLTLKEKKKLKKYLNKLSYKVEYCSYNFVVHPPFKDGKIFIKGLIDRVLVSIEYINLDINWVEIGVFEIYPNENKVVWFPFMENLVTEYIDSQKDFYTKLIKDLKVYFGPNSLKYIMEQI